MTYFKSIALVGAIAVSGAMTATDADALFLDGVFSITAYNYNATTTNGNTKRENSAATAATFADISSVTPTIGTFIDSDSFTYTGLLDFGLDDDPTTIKKFLDTGDGTVTGLDATFGGRTLSAGSFSTTTLFKITAASFANISNMSQITSVRHDDGFTMTDGTTSVSNEAAGIVGGPVRIDMTDIDPLFSSASTAANFTLYYAAANSDPSVLEVNVIPLPAAAWLLLGVSGALVAAKRQRARRDA